MLSYFVTVPQSYFLCYPILLRSHKVIFYVILLRYSEIIIKFFPVTRVVLIAANLIIYLYLFL